MQTYVYPTTIELTEIDAIKLPMSMEGNLAFELMPPKQVDGHILEWEQKDSILGLMKVRGMDGEPGRVAPLGLGRFMMTPGVYGEFTEIKEWEITARRRVGSVNETMDITDLTLERGEQLLDRQNMRATKIIWDLLCYGLFSSTNEFGAVVHTDSYRQRIYTPTVAWTTQATSTPLQDFRNVKLLARGYSVSFGSLADAIMNQVTFNAFIANTNTNDLAGRRTQGLGSVLSLELANALLLGEDLPRIRICEDFFLDDAAGNLGNFVMFIPNGVVIVVGKRARGVVIGDWAWTRNANNPGSAPGPYVWVYETPKPPRKVEVHRGFNGGTRLYFPSSVIVMKVF